MRETAEDFRVEVPVVFHVIWNSAQGAGWVSEERASAQVDVLNRAFGGRTLRHDGSANSNAVDTGVSFRLHAVRYTDVITDGDASRASFFREDCAPGAESGSSSERSRRARDSPQRVYLRARRRCARVDLALAGRDRRRGRR